MSLSLRKRRTGNRMSDSCLCGFSVGDGGLCGWEYCMWLHTFLFALMQKEKVSKEKNQELHLQGYSGDGFC